MPTIHYVSVFNKEDTLIPQSDLIDSEYVQTKCPVHNHKQSRTFVATSPIDFTLSIDRNNNKTWKEFWKLYPNHSMLIQHWGVGHSQVTWDLRQNPKIVDIFAHYWECPQEDLLVSFDGFSFHLPHEITKRGYFRGNTWYHTDQSYKRNELECIQSLEHHEPTAFPCAYYHTLLRILNGNHQRFLM